MTCLPLARYQALLFDLDGTLANSMGLHNEAWIGALKERGHAMTAQILQEYAGIQNPRTIELFNERFGWKLDAISVIADKEARFERNIAHVKPVEGVMAIAQKYRDEKKLAIVSGGHRELVKQILRALSAEDLFPVRVCAEDTKLGKPHPDPFLKAAELLGVKPEQCLVFEDGEAGIKGAKEAGMGVVRVGQGPDFKLEYLG
jgi:HAD superfamily hydrolase (TIGR01509 family)